MSQPTVTLLAGLIGALVGLVGERFLRSFGRLWCEPASWEMKFLSSFNEYGESKETPPEEAKDVTYSVRLDLFNGKEIPVGLRDISIVFSVKAERCPTSRGTRRAERPATALPSTRGWRW